MTRISLKIQQPAREVERHIDRANGAPAVEARSMSVIPAASANALNTRAPATPNKSTRR
jgi:hypothetical protein